MVDPLDLPSAVRMAHTAGCSWVTVGRLEESGLQPFHDSQADVLIWAVSRRDPVLGVEEAFVPGAVGGTGRARAHELERALPAVCDHLEVDRCLVALPYRHRASGALERAADYLDKRVGTAASSPDVREATERDWVVVRNMLARSIQLGYECVPGHPGQPPSGTLAERARSYVDSSFTAPIEVGARAVVAMVADAVVGYAAWLEPEVDLLNGQMTATLLDVDVVPEHHGVGLRQRLVEGVEARLPPETTHLRGQLTIEGSEADEVLTEKLGSDGWSPVLSLYLLNRPVSKG